MAAICRSMNLPVAPLKRRQVGEAHIDTGIEQPRQERDGTGQPINLGDTRSNKMA